MINIRNSTETLKQDFLSPKVAATKQLTHRFALITLWVIGGLFMFFILWAAFATLDVITKGQGQVVPSQKTQVVSHLEGGIIKKVLVKEGQEVDAGQVLMVIDPLVAEAQYQTNQEQYLRYLATAARLQAQLEGKDYQVPEAVMKGSPKIAEEEVEHYIEWKEQFETQKSIAENIVIQKEQELEEAKARLEQAETQLALSEEELRMVAPLVAEQLISKREILRLKRDAANLKGEIASGKASVPKLTAAIEQAKAELAQVPNRFENESQEQLRDVKIKLAEETGSVVQSKDRVMRTEIRSPVKGIVKEIKVKTIGSAIRPGEEVFTVVPREDSLMVEARVSPTDVAFLHPNQEATIKVTAYDYAIFGSLKGKLVEISPDTVYDEDLRQDFFRVKLVTDKNYLEYKGDKLPIIPGMKVEADILTGERTVLMYLLKPFIRGASESFTER